jgi:glycosyltransferase involved in cell wall biosynthesis
VTVGRLVATKGYWTILEAAHTLMRRDPSLRWTIVGDGPLRGAIEADERFQRLSGRLQLVGALGHEATLDVLRDGATAFVMPCERSQTGESDGIPVAFMEAMALGVPVITCAVGGIAELVEEGETGFLVQPRDPPALVAAVEHVLHGDPAGLDRVRRAARDRIEHEFEINGQAQVLVSLLSSVADGDADGASQVR